MNDEVLNGGCRGLRKLGEYGVTGAPYFDGIDIGVDDIFQVGCHGRPVYRSVASSFADPFGDIEDYACEAIFVEIYFLMVGNLSYGAKDVNRICDIEGGFMTRALRLGSYLGDQL